MSSLQKQGAHFVYKLHFSDVCLFSYIFYNSFYTE